jgi:type IV pilus assembly protein PilW
MTSSSDGLRVRTPAAVTAGDLLVISDCKRSSLFQVTGYTAATGDIAHAAGSTPAPGNQTAVLSDAGPAFDKDAEVTRLQTIVLFVGTDNQGRPALRRKLNADPSEVIVSDVENMQILYGLDTDATSDRVANRYVPAEHVNPVQTPRVRPDWQDVVSVRVALLMQSNEEVTGTVDTRTYDLLDEDVSTISSIAHAGDRRLRKVVTATVNVRN